jgi:phosphatidylinositol-3-phosphatase
MKGLAFTSLLVVAVTVACSSDDSENPAGAGAAGATGGNGSGGAPDTSVGPASGGMGATGGGGGGTPTTIFTIMMENHDYNEVVGSPNAPYMNQLIAEYGLATNYFDCGTHPSLPNYLYMIAGDTVYPGVIDVDPTQFPYFPSDLDNLGNQLEQAGIEWRSYQESMGTPCKLSASGTYAPKHDPFLYFSNIQENQAICDNRNVDYTQFEADLAAGTYRYMFITPNLINDGHDPSNDPVQGLQQSDAWLAAELPKILASTVYQEGGIVLITWDEAEGRDGNDPDQIPLIVVSPFIKSAGYQSNVHYTHGSYLATMEDFFGFPRLGAAGNEQNFFEFWQ